MTNRGFLEQVSTDGLPDASTVLEGAKPKRVWRRVAVAVVAAAAIGAVVTVGAQVHMNELEKIEASTGKEPITDITQLETGKLYTIEHHSLTDPANPRMFLYNYVSYNELPEGTNPRTVPMEPYDTFSGEDEWREVCGVCHGFVWTPTEPVEYSYQRPSASEPETFHVRTLNCAICGQYSCEVFDADGKTIPQGLYFVIADSENEEVTPPKIEGVTLYSKYEELEKGVVYRAFMHRGTIFFYESTPENNEKASCWIFCIGCRESDNPRDLLLGEDGTTVVVDDYGDEYTFHHHTMVCAECGEEALAFN